MLNHLIKKIKTIILKALLVLYSIKKHYQIAKTDSEKNEIYKLRYKIYQEFNYNLPENELISSIDSENKSIKMVKDSMDDLDNSILFYLKDKNKIIASVRMTIWKSGTIPDDILTLYDLNRYPWIKKYNICQVERFIAEKAYRGSHTISKFLTSSIKTMIQEYNTQIGLQCCKPYLVPTYHLLGIIPYTRNLINEDNALWVPLIGLTDIHYLKKINSPVSVFLSKKNILSKEHIKILTSNQSPVEFNREKIIYELFDFYKREGEKITDEIKDVFQKLVKLGAFILYIDNETKIVDFDVVDKTLYFLLNGNFSVSNFNSAEKIFPCGFFVGEFSYFSDNPKRTAEVKTIGKTTFLVIKSSAIEKLKKYDPVLYEKFLEYVIKNLILKILKTNDLFAQKF